MTIAPEVLAKMQAAKAEKETPEPEPDPRPISPDYCPPCGRG